MNHNIGDAINSMAASWIAKGMINSSGDIDKIKDRGSPDESRASIVVRMVGSNAKAMATNVRNRRLRDAARLLSRTATSAPTSALPKVQTAVAIRVLSIGD